MLERAKLIALAAFLAEAGLDVHEVYADVLALGKTPELILLGFHRTCCNRALKLSDVELRVVIENLSGLLDLVIDTRIAELETA